MYLFCIKKQTEEKIWNEKVNSARKMADNLRKYGDLKNEHNVHRMICDMAGGCKRKSQNLLYIKLGQNADTFYIQSDCMLDAKIVDALGYRIIQMKNLDTLIENIDIGDEFILRAKLAPAVKKKDGSVHSLAFVPNGKQEREKWLEEISKRNGFKFEKGFPEEGNVSHIYWDKKNIEKHTAWTNAFLYVGNIKVISREAFCNALRTGIGKYKAYGCGMLMISCR